MMSYDSVFKTKTHVFVYRMICSHQIHDDLKQMEESVCPFCGVVHYYDIVNEFIDFHGNMHKIHRKSVYQRKYHKLTKE